MTPETKLDLAAIKAKAEKAHKMVMDLCKRRGESGSREWIMSIPARPDYDPDLVIDASLSDVPALVAEVERLTARVAELEAAARDTLREADLRNALEDADRDCLGCGAKLMHGEVHRDGCAIGRLRALLAKGGAA